MPRALRHTNLDNIFQLQTSYKVRRLSTVDLFFFLQLKQIPERHEVAFFGCREVYFELIEETLQLFNNDRMSRKETIWNLKHWKIEIKLKLLKKPYNSLIMIEQTLWKWNIGTKQLEIEILFVHFLSVPNHSINLVEIIKFPILSFFKSFFLHGSQLSSDILSQLPTFLPSLVILST